MTSTRSSTPRATRMWSWTAAAALAFGVTAPVSPADAAGSAPAKVTAERTIAPVRVRQPGDLARSTYPRPAIFTVDRASRKPRLFSVARSGRVLGTLTLRHAGVRTPWVIAAGRRHAVWVGDIGDVRHRRPTIQVYRFREPRALRGDRTVRATRFVLRYPDGRHHATTLMASRTGRVFVVTRDGGLYRMPSRPPQRRVHRLVRVGSVPRGIVSGSFARNGRSLVLATRTSLYTYASIGGAPTVSDLPSSLRVANAEVSRGAGVVLVNADTDPHRVQAVRAPASADGWSISEPITWAADLDDEFDSLDTSVWRARDHQGYLRDDATVLARNVTAQDSMLRVQAKLEAADGRSYTTGDLDTYGKYSMPNYFRVEVRAKVPYEQGMWAAPIWIRPSDGSAGEIDLVETYGDQAARPIVHQTIHTEYGETHRQVHLQTPFSAVGGDPSGWHTYVVEKTPGQIVMWVDGVKTAEFNATNTSWFDTYYEAGKRWSLRSSLQIGGSHGLPDDTTDWAPDKTAMVLDHVKTWVPTR
jgi:beta-glucanase (GH16 family)